MAKINKKSNSSNSNLVQFNVTDDQGNFLCAIHAVDEAVEAGLITALDEQLPTLNIVAKEDYSSKPKTFGSFK